MTFASYDSLITSMTAGKRLVLPWTKNATTTPAAATWYSMWPVAGQPGAGVWNANDLTFHRTTDTTTGALYHGGNKSTDTKHLLYLMGLASAGSPPPLIMLVDMVGYYGPFAQVAGSQTLTNTNAPDRYTSAGQSGLQAVVVCTAVGGATASNITVLTYTDQDGNGASNIPTTTPVAVTVSAAAPTTTLGARVVTTVAGPFLPLAAGDCGMQSIQNITFSAANTGNYAIHMVKPLAMLPLATANVPSERDLVMQIANLERVYDGACLTWLVYFPAATGSTLVGEIDVAWG